jgi:hypothetical protein
MPRPAGRSCAPPGRRRAPRGAAGWRRPGAGPAAIANSAGSFALVTSHERAAAAPRNIRDDLAPGGRLIVGVEPPRLRAGRAPLRYWWHGTDKLLTLTGHTEADAVAHRTTSWNRRAGELIKTELEPFTLQWYGLSEFSAMLREAGFHHVTIHADYQTGQHPGTGKQDVDIRSHTRLRASAPGPRHPPARPRCARLPAPAGPSPRRTGRHLLPSRFGRRRDPSRPRTRLQPRRSARHTGESTSGGIDDLTSGRTGAQNWMIVRHEVARVE